jgi:hypothetical protein
MRSITSLNLQARRVMDSFPDHGWLRVDVPFEELVEAAAVLCSVETYLRITHRDEWGVNGYKTWCRRMSAVDRSGATALIRTDTTWCADHRGQGLWRNLYLHRNNQFSVPWSRNSNTTINATTPWAHQPRTAT